jgi:hypothetical protein
MQTMKGKLMLLAVVAVIAGCTLPGAKSSTGGGSSQGGSASTETGGAGVAATATLNKEFWYGGFHVTLGQVQYTPAPKPTPGVYLTQGKVVIQARFENLGPDTSNYNATTSLAVGTNQYTDVDGQDQKVPNVPGKAVGTGALAFFVDNKFDLAKSVMTVGSAQYNQAIIPFGTSGSLISLAPIKVPVTGSLVMPGLYKLDITGGDLAYDNSANHSEENAGEQLLVVHFSRTALVDTCCISASQFSLKLPDGTAVAADRVEECCGIGTAGTTKPDQLVTFVFKKADGSYDMISKEKVQGNDVQADVAFTITNGSGAGASPGSGGSSGGGANPTPSGH